MNEEELKRTFEEINRIDRQDFLEGFIRELNNYGFTSEYLGVFSAQIVALFEKEIKTNE